MSIVSDFKANFLDENSGAIDFIINEYENPESDVFINFFGVFDIQYTAINSVAVKPLERGQFTVDSKQIKPYVITITGIFLPDELHVINSYQELTDYVTAQIEYCEEYKNGIQQFSLFNSYSFGLYEPLTLFGITRRSTADSPIPDVTLMFSQIQSSDATKYNTVDATPYSTQKQNLPRQ